jgi:hypothetical protein
MDDGGRALGSASVDHFDETDSSAFPDSEAYYEPDLLSLSLSDIFTLGSLANLDDKIRNTKHRLVERRRAIERRVRTPEVIRLRDKLSFVLGLLNVLFTEYVILRQPARLWQWYLYQLTPLLILRYYSYRKSAQHYFMYDYCYFVQALLVAFYFGWPRTQAWRQVMFVALFASANGPVLWAMVAWRNALVFHSLDKMTSVFIHIFPPLVTYNARWHSDLIISRRIGICSHEADCIALGRRAFTVAVPLVIFLIWQTLYLAKILVISRRKLDRNPELITSLRWLTRHSGSAVSRMLNIFGERYQNLALAFWQLIFTGVTCLPTALFWRYKWMHEIVLAFVGLIVVWNGSNYYFEVFASRYTRRMLEYARDRVQKIETNASSNPEKSST